MKNKFNLILGGLLIIAIGIISYQNIFQSESSIHVQEEDEQLYTCGMHPDIVTNEPGNCPICEMKLTPIKSEEKSSEERKIAYWAAPMNPNEIYDEAGKSAMGMDLVPVYENELEGGSIVKIDPEVQQNMNLKIAEIESKSISTNLVTNGVVTTDERKEYLITSRIGGWIEKLYVNYTGQQVSKGQKLLDIYSPELVAAQKEYLTALNYRKSMSNVANATLAKSGETLLKNSFKRLELLEMSSGDIESLSNSKEVKTYISIYSPADGIVLKKDILEGEQITSGEMLMHISDLSNLWVIADVYEHEINRVKKNSKVKLYVNSFPNKTFSGKVSFIHPTLDSKTRTVKVRIDVPNAKFELKPSMLVRVEIDGEVSDSGPVISEEAVIRSGRNNIAVLNLGNGKFKPVEVKLGAYSNGYYKVLEGLQPGNKIVTSAHFLIDSESRLKSAIKQFSSSSADPKMTEAKKQVMDTTKAEQQDHEGHTHSTMENEYGVDSPLIRTGVIDVRSIDKNGDGKIYECPMDWNILADEYQRCPVCEMKMKEYTIDEVKSNLEKYGYEYKKNSE